MLKLDSPVFSQLTSLNRISGSDPNSTGWNDNGKGSSQKSSKDHSRAAWLILAYEVRVPLIAVEPLLRSVR